MVEGHLNFRYATDWLTQADAVALSCSLPLQAESFDDHKARPFFAGLLPEGQMRRLIARQFQVSVQNDFALLDHIGGECAGAVTFLEPGQSLRYPIQAEMAMKLGSKYKFSEVEARHWGQFAEAAGLSVAKNRQRII